MLWIKVDILCIYYPRIVCKVSVLRLVLVQEGLQLLWRLVMQCSALSRVFIPFPSVLTSARCSVLAVVGVPVVSLSSHEPWETHGDTDSKDVSYYEQSATSSPRQTPRPRPTLPDQAGSLKPQIYRKYYWIIFAVKWSSISLSRQHPDRISTTFFNKKEVPLEVLKSLK